MKQFVKKEIEISDNNHVTLYEISFQDSYEMIDFINNASYVEPWTNQRLLASHYTEESRCTWARSESLEEAIELFKFGDKSDIDKLFNIKMEINNLMPYISTNRTTQFAPYGSRPSVPRYLMSNPNCMYKIIREEYDNVINIYYNVSSLHHVDNNAIERRGMLTLALIELLESMDYRVNLSFFDLNYIEKENILIRLNIKDAMQTLDPKICFFPLCHPAFIRRITLAVMEKCKVKNEKWAADYGIPNTNGVVTSKILNLNDKDIFISNFDYEFGSRELFEDMEIFFEKININKFIENDKEIKYDKKTKKFVLIDKTIESECDFNKQDSSHKKIKRRIFGKK